MQEYSKPIVHPSKLSPQQLEAVKGIIAKSHIETENKIKDAFNLGICYGLGLVFGESFLYQVYEEQQKKD